MELSTEGSDELSQSPLVRGMDVLVIRLDLELFDFMSFPRFQLDRHGRDRTYHTIIPFFLHSLQAVHDLGFLVLGQDPNKSEGF